VGSERCNCIEVRGCTLTALTLQSVPRVSSGFRLQYESAQECHVLLYPEGMVKLNQTAGEILSRCDGQRTVTEVVAELEQAFSTTGLETDVMAFMTLAKAQLWLSWE
jgi:pyrroloquinoline quinone biosynthesis protein D